MLSVPAANNLRVLVGENVGTMVSPDRLHWTWSILGDRNWTRAAADGTHLELSETYPLNDVHRLHGTNAWNCDLYVERTAADPKRAHWTLFLHGSNNVTAQSGGTAALGSGEIDALVHAQQTGNTTLSVPGTIELARIADAIVDLKTAP